MKSIKSIHRKLTKRMTDKELNDRKIKIAKRKQAREEVLWPTGTDINVQAVAHNYMTHEACALAEGTDE